VSCNYPAIRFVLFAGVFYFKSYGVTIFFTTEKNGRKTERERKKRKRKDFYIFFFFIGQSPIKKKGCPFWITHEIFHFDGYC